MSDSLRDQLIKAGFSSKEQPKRASAQGRDKKSWKKSLGPKSSLNTNLERSPARPTETAEGIEVDDADERVEKRADGSADPDHAVGQPDTTKEQVGKNGEQKLAVTTLHVDRAFARHLIEPETQQTDEKEHRDQREAGFLGFTKGDTQAIAGDLQQASKAKAI